MIQETGVDLQFFFKFTASATGKTGLAPTVQIWRNRVSILSGQSMTDELGGGLYYYTLLAASNTVAGDYVAQATTADVTVDQKIVDALWIVRTDIALTTDIPTPPTANAIADQVWNETLADHVAAGSTGAKLDELENPTIPTVGEIADSVWDEPLADHVSTGSTGEELSFIHGVGGSLLTVTCYIDDESTVCPGAKVWMEFGGEVFAGWDATGDDGSVQFLVDFNTTYDIKVNSALADFEATEYQSLEEGLDDAISIIGTAVQSGASFQMPTLGELRDMLRMRLNDMDEGNYLNAELDYCINQSYKDTVALSKCHKDSADITLVEDDLEYDTCPVFEAIEVSLNGAPLDKKELGSIGVSIKDWLSTAAGTPARWAHLSGSNILIHPKPSAGVAGDTLTVYGYCNVDDMTSDSDRIVAAPFGTGAIALLDRAESLARRMRITKSHNPALCDDLDKAWTGWCMIIRDGISGASKK